MFAPALLLPRRVYAASPRSEYVTLYNPRSRELIDIQYKIGDQLIPMNLRKIDYFLRDFRTNEVHRIDPHLYEQLSFIADATHAKGPFNVISAYRTKQTNDMLRRKHIPGVAKDSFHMYGQALDIRGSGIHTSDMREAALELRAGGVGYYPRSDFIHIDTGRFRTW